MNVADFRTLILQEPTVSALVGARMYPLVIPQEVFDSVSRKPCLVYTVATEARTPTFCTTQIGLHRTSVDVDCYGTDFDTCIDCANAVQLAVTDFVGVVGSTKFGPIFVENVADTFDANPGLFRRIVTLTVWSD